MAESLLSTAAWAAGIVDGEGNFALNTQRYPVVRVGQCDREMLERLQTLFGGAIYGPYQPKSPRANPIWYWHLDNSHRIRDAVEQMWPWLGTVKRAQYESVMSRAKDVPRPGYCRKDLHVLDENRAPTEKRCRLCRNERLRLAYHAAKVAP